MAGLVRVLLVVAVVVAILLYLSVLKSGGGLLYDGFTGVGTSQPQFTLFWMKGCPHCESIIDDFNRFAAAGQFVTAGKPVTVRALEQAEAGPLLEQKGVQGFPTFILTTADGRDLEYKGERNVNGYKQFIVQNVK